MINGSISILESEAEISKRILKALLPQVDKHFKKAFLRCENQINDIVMNAIVSNRTYSSLVSGQLKTEFGLDNASGRLSEILTFWRKITVDYKKPKIVQDQIKASFSLSMIKSDYSDVLKTSGATVNTEKGSKLEWLEWLLLFGDKTIVKEYEIKLGPNPKSRSGGGIMINSKNGRWSVPPAFAGTAKKNWITEAIDSVEDDIMALLTKSLGV
tara:strand:- start:8727 stop:9365 length:639 start_codon:yes stop_codon:yes gene_type:complete